MATTLQGIRVIDFGQYIAGPLTAMLLADQGAEVIRVDPPGGPRMQTPANATWNRGKLRELFATRTSLEWEATMEKIGVPCARCRTAEEWLTSDHARAGRASIAVTDSELGEMWQPGTPVRLHGSEGAVPSPRHVLNADRDAVVASLTSTPQAAFPAGRHSSLAPLAGFKVLDLTQVLAGPTAGRTLAEYGADVIKINGPTETPLSHSDVNRGKRTILLDLKTPKGLDLFWKLFEGADAVLHNFRKVTMERLGIGYEQLRERKPDIVFLSVSAFGHDGEWGGRPGYETNGQAMAGLMERFGGDGEPASQPFAVNDYGTGLTGAMATTFGLFHKVRTGKGQRIEAALALTSGIYQSAYASLYDGKQWDEPRGQEALGAGPLQRLYRANDGWFFVGAKTADLGSLAKVAGLDGIDQVTEEHLAPELESRLANRSVADWVADLTAAGVGAHGLVTEWELAHDPWVEAHGLSVTRDAPGGGTVTTIGPPARFSRTPVGPGRPVPAPGADGAEVLATIGMADRLDALVAAGVVRLPRQPVHA